MRKYSDAQDKYCTECYGKWLHYVKYYTGGCIEWEDVQREDAQDK